MSATDCPNAFHLENCSLIPLRIAVINHAWDRGEASMKIHCDCDGGVCKLGRDVIATVYRLGVAIATPRIELGGYCCHNVAFRSRVSR